MPSRSLTPPYDNASKAAVSQLTMAIAHLPSFPLEPLGLSYLTLDAQMEGKPVCDEPSVRPHAPLCSRIAPPATTPNSLCLAKT